MAMVKTDSQHYADIAAAIRNKSGGSASYKPREMSSAILGLETGGQGSSILVYAPAGSSVILTSGDITRTVQEDNGLWRFDNCGLGTWKVTASKDGSVEEITVEIQEEGQLMRYEVQVKFSRIFGVMRDITSSSPAWTRTDEAVGFTATASVGAAAGQSDFDSVYPWRDIQRETLSTGDVMVSIPKFWYRRYREGNMEYIKIASSAADGFSLHPAFCHGGVEKACIYVGAYKTSASNLSQSGVAPRVSKTRSNCRTQAKSKGTGWGLLDMSTLSALQMLFLVEFATYNSQIALGSGYTGKSSTDSSLNTGTTDGVPNLTGRPAGTTDVVDVVYRGVETLWGNVFDYVDGVIVDGANKTFYVCNDPSSYADALNDQYVALSYGVPQTGTTAQYITQLGLQEGELAYVMLPANVTSGSATTYVCDSAVFSSSSTPVFRRGGKWNSKTQSGIFNYDAIQSLSIINDQSGSRLIYIP